MIKAPDTVARSGDRRRLIALVHMDMVGYSRLMGLDDVGTLRRLQALRRDLIDPAIEEHGGRLVNTGGDSLLIAFESVEGAVRYASTVQQHVAVLDGDQPPDHAIRFRVGINLGDTIVEGTDLYGDAVNVAARLQSECPPGGICVSRSVREHVHGRLGLEFEELGPLSLKNIARPIDAYLVRTNTAAAAKSVERSLVYGRGAALPLPDKPSIAVLAFNNMSADPDQEYFADGISEDIIATLSRSRSLFVIARNSSFTYKNRAVDVRQIGRELGVRYVLEGSVRRSGTRVRVVAQLIEAETGNHIWAERYDRALEDVFAVQDEIAASATVAILPALTEAEQRRALRKHPESLDAWEAYMRGLWHEGQGSAADHEVAKQFFQRATELDPAFAPPYSALAEAYVNDVAVYATLSLTDAVKLSGASAQKAIVIDPEDAEAQAIMAYAAMLVGNSDEAHEHLRLATASNPNSPSVLFSEGSLLLCSGDSRRARESVLACLRLEPRGPRTAGMMQHIAISYYYERNYTKAVEAARQTVARYPVFHLTYRWLAAALGQFGQLDEAQLALRMAIELSPQSFEFYVRNRPPWHKPENHEHMLEGLRKAGWQG